MSANSGRRRDSESERSAFNLEWAYVASLLYLRSECAAGFTDLETQLVPDATNSVVTALTPPTSLYLRLPSLLRWRLAEDLHLHMHFLNIFVVTPCAQRLPVETCAAEYQVRARTRKKNRGEPGTPGEHPWHTTQKPRIGASPGTPQPPQTLNRANHPQPIFDGPISPNEAPCDE